MAGCECSVPTVSRTANPPFWKHLSIYGINRALVDGRTGEVWTYTRLADELARIAEALCSSEKALVALPLDNTIADIIWYLGALASDHAVLLYSRKQSSSELADVIGKYKPDVILGPALPEGDPAYELDHCAGMDKQLGRRKTSPAPIHPGLSLMLATSGSTGSQKYVRLSDRNLDINAEQIVASLHIDRSDIAVTSLPLSYIYGLSVLNSHLKTGACVVVDDRSVMEKSFWECVTANNVSTLAGVPATYAILQSIRVDQFDTPSLRKLTVSGDKLSTNLAQWLSTEFAQTGRAVYAMYGQTEAAGRICVLPSQDFRSKGGAVGYPVPGGNIAIGTGGEVIYSGPNVMMGYAHDRADLAQDDKLGGILPTGDLGYLDGDGCLYLTGRTGRIAKVYGKRVNLDDIPSLIEI